MKIILICFALISSYTFAQNEIITLYPDGVPGLRPEASSVKEENNTGTDGVLRVRSVTNPTLTVYRPAKGKGKGAAVIICPGGGYHILAINKEGYKLGEWFAENGVTAFVLKYRLPQDELFTEKKIRPLQDAQQAFRIVRNKAAEFGVNPSKIGIMGFSAGGHLAATASTHFEHQVGEITDQSVSVRPDFSILMYPVISFNDRIAHLGSRNNLIGPDLHLADIEDFSNELQVSENTPPAILIHAFDDGVRMENSLEYVQALKNHNVSAELHLFAEGGHGFGMALDKKSPVSTWTERLKDWMTYRGLM